MSNDKLAQARAKCAAVAIYMADRDDVRAAASLKAGLKLLEELQSELADHEAEKQPPSAGKCPSCGSDCNERDELIKAEREIDRLRERLAEREAEKQAGPVAGLVAAYTEGHCAEKRKPGGCTLHNLHCGYPACDRKAAPPTPLAEQGPVDGWKLVPVEPTAQMKGAGHAYARGVEDPSPTGMYAAMLAVAPPSPLSERDKEYAADFHWLIDNRHKYVWHHVLHDEEKAGHESIYSAIRAARAKKGS